MSAPDVSRPPDGGDDATAPVPARNFRQDAPRLRRCPCRAPRPDPDPQTIARAHPAAHVPARFRRHFRGRCRRVRQSRRRRLAVPGCARSATLAPTAVTTPLFRQPIENLRSAPDASVPAGVVAAARFRKRSRPDRRRIRRSFRLPLRDPGPAPNPLRPGRLRGVFVACFRMPVSPCPHVAAQYARVRRRQPTPPA